VGAFMSGGLDSAAIVSVMRAKSPGRLRTFSVTVEDPRFDESTHQATVARWLDTEHAAVRVTGRDVRALFPTVVHQSEAPLVRTIAVASSMLARSVQEAGVRVVLSGEGADELLLGYDVAKEAAFLEKWSSLGNRQERVNWIQGLFHDAVISKPFDADRVVDFYEGVDGSPEMALGAHLRRFSMEPDFAAVGRDAGNGQIWTRDVLEHLRVLDPHFDERRVVERAQVIDFVTLLSGYGLACQADRPGVVHSVESRFPFLDPALARFAWSLPVDLRLQSGRREKHILREAFSGALPPETTRRRKQAMRVPGAEVLKREGGKDWVADLISDGQLRRSSVVDPVSSRSLIDRVHATDGKVPYPDNHAYCLLLSTLLLEDHYVHRFAPPQEDVDTPLVRRVDRRRLRAG
jgi:asparagine synthase (glutamine-hydrolysing)